MSKQVALENEINWLRTVFTILAAAFFGVFAWVAHHYENAVREEIVFASLLLFVMIISAVLINILINKRVYRNLTELEALEDKV